jgi:hypothetical protein
MVPKLHLYFPVLKKRIFACSKKVPELSGWISKIVNHFYYCVFTCPEDVQLRMEKFLSLEKHVINIHEWDNNGTGRFFKCEHGVSSEDTKWLDPGIFSF